MSKISSMMDVGKRSLSNSQTALQTVSHNIANKSTEGFSRQRVDMLSMPAIGSGNLQIGMGARAGTISRTNNPWLEKQIQRENTQMGYLDGQADALARVEQVYNEQMNKGLNQYMTDFFNGFRELSANPESSAGRAMVREAGFALAADFKRVVGQLREIQGDIDAQLATSVAEINDMTKEIATLNQKICTIEVQPDIHANDERDRRDLLLKKLGEKMEVSWAEGRDGQVTVTAGSSAVLVSGFENQKLSVLSSGERGRMEVYYSSTENGTRFNFTNQFKGGRVGGVLEIRDKVIENLLNHVDNMAHTFANQVNSIHGEGFDRYGNKGGPLFEISAEKKYAAETMELSKAISADIGRIAAGAKPNAPGDNTIANILSSLQHQKVMNGGEATFDDYYNRQVGEIGSLANRANKTQEMQKNSLVQLKNIRESISGVSLDEEASKMIEFQKAYDASARLIKTADEMFETVLNLKRL